MNHFMISRRAVTMMLAAVIIGQSLDAFAGARRRREKNKEVTTLNESQKVPAGQQTAGNFRRDLSFGGDQRYYEMHVPASYKPGSKVPLVLVFHGGGGNPSAVRNTTGFDAVSDREGFVAVYPAGTGKNEDASRLSWNILLSDTPATQNKKDDLGFVRAVLKDVTARLSIDERRIFATGISQGGMMCYRLACDSDLSGRIAAIAPVAGVMTVPPGDCRPSRAMPILHFHGKNDAVVPYQGGQGGRIDPVTRPSVADTMKFWLAKNKLGDTPRDRGNRGKALFQDFGKEGAPGEVTLWSLEDGGHTWPGGESGLPEFIIGKVNRDISATEIIWKFFSRHSLP